MWVFQAIVLGMVTFTALLVALNHGDYRRPRRRSRSGRLAPPLVSVIVPMRDEAGNARDCLTGLLAQDYPALEVIVLDDGSTDGTRAVLNEFAADPRLNVLTGNALPPGWAGKSHACWQAAQSARGEWLLFLDADTRHEPTLVSTAVAEAESRGADLLSTFPQQQIGSLGEALTVPMALWTLFTMLPIRATWASRMPALSAACGQMLLARRAAYFDCGGHQAIRGSLHDGIHLARLFKRHRRRVALADLSQEISCRMYRGWDECRRGFTRNAFQAIGSLPGVFVVIGWHLLVSVSPLVSLGAATVAGWPPWGWLALAQALVLAATLATVRRRFRLPWATLMLHPVAVLLFARIQIESWLQFRRGAGSTWRGRVLLQKARV